MLIPPAENQKVRVCVCPEPAESPNPRSVKTCNRCLGAIKSLVTDEVVAWWFDRLAESIFHYAPSYKKGGERVKGRLLTSPNWDTYRKHSVAREREGREKFGNLFMNRDNIKEGREEFCDGALYPMLDTLRYVIETGGDDRDIDLALTAARKAYEAYVALLELQAKRAGAP